ncbi:MAG TPA: T9SS type A sorting domain-containing protein, partial [Bacteroidales bacterium]|nr:T9SS type A sorting domain-containing protein [Bacteroidales bacterium]
EDEMIQSVELFSILGTSVLKMNNIAQNTVVIDLSTLQGGMYVVKINTQSYVYYKKMLRY